MQGALESIEGMMAAPILQAPPKAAIQATSRLDSLVLRVRGGDVEAFDTIMAETQGRVMGLAYRLLGDRELAKDASQEAFLRAFRSLGTFRLGDPFSAWIGRICANVCFDLMKRREAGKITASDPLVLESIPSPDSLGAEDAILLNQRRALVQRALAILSAAERSALVLRDIEGLSTEEAAQTLGLRPGTVRANISQARRKVKDFCQRFLHGAKPDKQAVQTMQTKQDERRHR